MSAAAVDKAYAEVQRVTRERAKNFAYGIMVLPAEKRRAIAAVYAFAREVDDVADGDLPLDEKRARLEALRASLDDEAPTTSMAVALADARARFDIPKHALAALVDGGLQDTEQVRYASFEDLRGYCEKVAGAVGVACVAVYGSDDVERARTLGTSCATSRRTGSLAGSICRRTSSSVTALWRPTSNAAGRRPSGGP